MCLALPGEVTAVDGDTAMVDLEGVALPVSLAFLDDVQPGDFVIVHVGYALSKIDKDEAAAQLALMRAAGDTAQWLKEEAGQ